MVIAVVLGALTGMLFNKTKGQEMITGMILGFFAVGVFDLIFIFMVGTIIPMYNEEMMLQTTTASGETRLVGLRNTIELHTSTKYAIDNALNMPFLKFLPWLLGGFIIACAVAFAVKKLYQGKQTGEILKELTVPLVITACVALVQILAAVSKPFRSIFTIVQMPVFTAVVIALFCIIVALLMKTKLGHDIRTVGLDMNVAKTECS